MKLFPKYEGYKQKVAPLSVFARRLISAVGLACGIIGIVLFIGVAGYHWLDDLNWIDSLLEASMILGGMGPVSPIKTTSAKVFASAYALFSGLVFIGIMGIVLTPIAHRLLHKFHVE
jgi:hypothetical protein